MRRTTLCVSAMVAACAVTVGLLFLVRSARSAHPVPSPPSAAILSATLTVEPATVSLGSAVRIVCTAAGVQGPVGYTWQVAGGVLQGSGATVTWTPPWSPGRYAVHVTVLDSRGRATARAMVSVRLPTQREAPAWATPRREADPGLASEIQALAERVDGLLVADGPYAPDEWRKTLSDLAALFLRAGRYDEARVAYWRLLGDYLPDDRRSRVHRRGYGEAAFFLGREDEALEAFLDADLENTRETRYALGWLLEKRGRLTEAAQAYEQAARGDRWFAEPMYRAALLFAKQGEAARAVELLVWASPALGRDAILERLATDPELATLKEALALSQRDLEEQRDIVEGDPLPAAQRTGG